MTPDGRRPARRRPSGGVLVAVSAWALAELSLLGWSLTTRVLVVFVLGQALLLALAGAALVIVRFRAARAAYEADLARAAVTVARARLAEELHDALGHELSLVALRASALQVTSSGAAAEQAAELRAQVEQAVLHLRQTVELLRVPGLDSPAPGTPSAEILVERTRSSGAVVSFDDRLGAGVPEPVRMTAARVIQEGLTNALKHSPGVPLVVRQWDDADGVHVEVVAGGEADEDRASWSGLAGIERRVDALGGSLSIASAHGRRILRAELPTHLARMPAEPDIPTGRPPAAATLAGAFTPLAVVLVVATAFHLWSTRGATLEQDTFMRISVGQPLQEVRPLLPPRQSPVRLTPLAPAPRGSACAYYSDGNVPLGMATYEICTDGTRVTRISDLRTVPWR